MATPFRHEYKYLCDGRQLTVERARLASLQRRYEAARRSGEQAGDLAGEIAAYQQAEGVRLRAVAPAYRVE